MCIHKSLLAIAGVAVLGVLMTASAQAWNTDTNYVTFSAPVALPGVTLAAGTYVFRSPTELDKNVVQVLNRKQTETYFMGFTAPADRPLGQPDRMVIMGEAAPGQATPIKAWFPLGERDGHMFKYDR
jgi:hypothetical protein